MDKKFESKSHKPGEVPKQQSGNEPENSRKEYLQEYRDAWQRDSFVLNGTKIEMFGIAHYPETLEVPEFKAELESAIENSSIVLYEIIPSQNKYSPKELAEARIAIEPSMKGAEGFFENYYDRTINRNPNFQFYDQLEAYAAKKKKPIAVSDPLEDVYKSILLEKCDASAQEAKYWTMLISATLATGVGIASLLKKPADNFDWNKKISRRGFAKILAGSAASVALGSFLSQKASEKNKNAEQMGRAKNPFGFALYEINDFRDAAAAEGLERLSKKFQGDKPVSIIYGSKHISSIKQYALSPLERKAKLLAYGPYRQHSGVETKIYEFDEKWQLVEKL